MKTRKGGRGALIVLLATLVSSGCTLHGVKDEAHTGRTFSELALFSWLTSEVDEEPDPASEAVPGTTPGGSAAGGRGRLELAPVEERATPRDRAWLPPDAVAAALGHRQSIAPEAHDDIWVRIRTRMILPQPGPEVISEHLDWVHGNERYFERIAARAAPYIHHITESVEQRNMPGEVALLPILESAFQPLAYSSSGAAGLWQIIPSTGRHLGLKQNWWYDGRRDLLDATTAALDYLERLHADLNDWPLAFAAYNAGEGTVARAQAASLAAGKGTDFWSIRSRLPTETQSYVPRLLAIAAAVRAPQAHGLNLPPIANNAYFAVVPIGSQLDLDIAASMAAIDLADFRALNPGFKRWTTDPDGPHRVLVPRDSEARFRKALAALPPEHRVTLRRHQVAAGETLGAIARRYGTRTDVLRTLNKLPDSRIRAGHALLIPAGPDDSGPEDTGSAVVATAVSSTSAGSAVARRAAPPHREHTVRAGESMWGIARHYDTRVAHIGAANRLAPGSVLRPGQVLRIPAHASAAAALTASASTPTRGSAAQAVRVSSTRTLRSYTVQAGDSLWSIARRAGLRVADLRAWNGLGETHLLRPGQTLSLQPPPAPRQI